MNGSQLLLPFAYALLISAAGYILLRRYFYGRRARSRRECRARLNQLGFRSLQEYRNSDRWREKRLEYQRSDYPQRCLVCRARRVDLHHRTYARLGEEELFDLIPLCRRHHDELHELLDSDSSLCIKDTHDYLAVLKKRERQRSPKRHSSRPRTRSHGSRTRSTRRAIRRSRSEATSRTGMTWTEEEDAVLLRGFHEGTPVDQLAKQLHRGVKSIEVRLIKLGQSLR